MGFNSAFKGLTFTFIWTVSSEIFMVLLVVTHLVVS